MVAIVAGNGLGLFNTSLNSLGGTGVFGQGTLGQAGGQGYVNASNGNLILQFNDEQLSGRSQSLLHLRTYNAQGALNDADGDGWRWEGERRLNISGLPGVIGSTVTRTTGDGYQATYTWGLTGYQSAEGSGAHDTIVLAPALLLLPAEWVWTDGSTRAVERYDLNGRLKSYTNANGQTTTYGYDGSGRLTSVKDSSGQELVMVYNAGGKLQRLDTRTTSGGPLTRQVYYAYDTSGRLTSVTTDLTPADNSIADGKVYTTSYTYDGSSFRIASISQSDGTSAAYTYQLVAGDYRVASVTDASGTTTFSYDTANRRTDVTNGLGQVWSYHYDTAGQLIQVQTPSVTGSGRLSTSYAYDSQGNVTSITDGLGNTITYEYDAKGNRTLERDALGNTVRRSYNSTNQLLSETTYTEPATLNGSSWTNPPESAAQTTHYVYDIKSNLRYVVDATGSVTEYRYSSSGLRLAEVLYGDATYNLSGLLPLDVLDELLLTTWAATRDKAKQQLTEFTYDYRGNVTKSTTFAYVNILGAGVLDDRAQVMEYVYSEHGQLLQTIAVRGANRTTKTTLSSMVYDGMGRLLSQVDANGTQTLTYNGVTRQMAVTNSAGLTTTQAFDVQGRLVSISQAATGETTRTTQYVYDAAGRLTLSQDPTGVRNYTFYDEAGRVSARVDGTGAVIEYIYNAAGQLTQQKHYANQVTEATRAAWFNGSIVMPTLVSEIRPATHTDDRTISYAYDSAGRQTSSTNGIGTVTTYGYDGSHQLVSVKTGARTTRTFYDAVGRQLGQLDAEGYLRENIYNVAGQLVQVIRYAALTPSAQRASGSLDDLRPDATGALSTWYFYDNAGRQIGSVDEQGFVTETVFNEATNTRQSIRYATAYTSSITTSTTFASIRTAVASGAKQSITAVFDGMGRLSSQTQQDGTVTSYEYDVAGRLVKETAASGTTESRALTSRYNAFGEVTGRLLGEASALVVAGMTPAQVAAIYDQFGLTWSYDAAGRQVSVKDAFGNRSVSYYDEAGRLTHVVNALGEVKESLYNAFGEVSERTAITSRLSAANTNSLTGGLLNTTMKSLVAGIKNAANDNRSTYTYNKRGLLATSTDAMGWLTSSTYSAFGELASLTRRISSSVTVRESYTYNKRGELLTRAEDTAALNRTTSATYDAFGRVTSRTDGRGLTTTTTYDLNGRQITVTDPLNQTRVSQYDAWGRVLTETDARGQVTSYSYNDITRTLVVNLPEGVTLTTVRNRHGEVVSSTNGESRTTQQQYNKDGQLVVTIDARGQSASRAYDQAGRLSSVTDVRGFTTTFAYDAANRVVTKTDALGTITSYVFDGQGRQITVTEAVGKPEARQTDYAYDRKGQLLTVTRDPNGLALRTTYAYDGIGRQVQVSEGTVASPDQRVVAYTFDKLGRRTAEQIDPTGLNLTTQYFYNGNDQVTRTIDAAGNSTWYVYDNAGRLTETVDALGAVTRNTYDANGNVISTRRFINPVVTTSFGNAVTSVNPTANAALDQITTYAYDNLNRLTSTTDALGHVESYTYDKAGNRITLTNKNGDTWHYRYDELNRLSEEITPAIQVSSIATNGQVSTLTRMLVTRIEYDAAGNVISRSEGRQRVGLGSLPSSDNLTQSRTTTYAYDAVGRQTLITSPGWYNKTTGAYQLASSGTTSTFQVTTEVTYDAIGNAVRNRVRINNTGTVANDFIDNYKTYDKAGRVVHEIDALNGVTTYSHDAVDNVLTIKRHANALNYAVPASGYYVASDITTARLVPDAANDRTMTMSYDAAGRKISVQLDLVNIYTTSLSSPTQGAPTTLYTYDAMGRVIKETQVVRNVSGATIQTGASLHSYYDKVGNQIGSVDALGYLTRNTYDALGQLTRSVEYNNKLSTWGTALPGTPSANVKDRSTAYAYDRLGRLTTVTKENVTVWRHNITSGNAYTVAASVLNAVETTGNLVVDQRTYDKVGNMLTLRDGANNVTTMGYNALGHMTSLVEPARLVAMADPINSFENNIAYAISTSPQTVYVLNAFGQVISETRTPGAYQAGWTKTTKTRYDQTGHEIEHIDAANASAHYKVDAAGRRIESRQQVSAQFNAWTGNTGYSHEIRQTYGYDKLGQQLFTRDYYSSTAYSGQSVTYNRFGEVSAELLNGGANTIQQASYTYDQAGRVTLQQNAQGTTSLDYDMAGRVTRSTQQGDGTAAAPDRVTRTEYDASGRATRQYQPQFVASTTTNPLSTITTSVVTPTITQTYDRWGNVLSRTDQRGFTTTYTYDHENRVLTETLPQTNILRTDGTSYRASLIQERRYDALGNVLHEVDWVGPYTGMSTNTHLRTRTHAYNAVGELIRDIDALNVSRLYMVDASGNRVTTRDALAKISINTYDAMDRQLTHGMMLKNSNDVLEHRILQTNKYDQAGRKYAEINGTVEVQESYGADRYNQMTVGTVRYTVYDQRGNVVQTRNESAVGRTYQFDAYNRKIRETHLGVAAGQNNRYMTWTYDNSQYGRLSARRDFDGRQYAYTYNVYGQLAKESLNDWAGLDKTYEYYDNGMLKKVTEGSHSYDLGVVVLQEKRSSTYVYDRAGNRVREIDEIQTNRPTTPTTIRQSSTAETRYRYDEQGRLIGMFVPSGNKHLVGIANGSYNYTTANSGRVDTLTYDYDEVGNRRRTVFNTTNQDNTTVNKERWFTYDKEDRMLQGDMIMEDGKLYYWAYANGETSGYHNYYNAAGQVILTYQFNNYGTTTLNGVTYLNSPIYEVLSYAYDDQNRLTSIDSRYRAYHQPNGQAAQWFTPDTVKQTTFTGGAVVTNSSKIRMRSTYDSNGNLQANSVRTYKLNGTLDSVSDSTWSYRGDGKAVYQSSSEQKGSVLTTQKIFFNDVGDIDSQGNQLKYRMEYKSGSTAFTNTYTKTYAAFDGYKELTTTVTRPGMTTGVTTHSYTERGELKQVSATGGTSFTRQLANNREGLITSRRENSGKVQNYTYFQGSEVASFGNANAPELANAYAMTWRSDYVASRPTSYPVSAGDTLAGIAQLIWGDSRMWYLIADANGLAVGANDPLEGGSTLRIPAVAGSTKNNATTFKPYNPSDIIGDISPNPKAPPPPKKKCGGVLQAIVLVVAVVATVVTGGAAAAALGGAASTFLGGAAVAAAGAVAGSVAGQLTAMATGLQSEFSWSALGKSALTGALTGGLLNGLGINSSLNEALKSGASYGQVAAYSIAQNLVGQGIAHAVGVQKGFSWASVVASAVGGMFDMRFGGSGSVTEPGKLGGFSNSSIDGGFSWSAVGSNTLRSLGRNVVTTTTQIAINGHGKLDLLSVTADAFGNALGNSIVGAMQVNKAEKKVQELEAALKELDILKEDAKAVRDALVDPSKRSLLLSKGFDPDKMRATYVANLVSGDVYLDYSSAENGNADKVARMQEAMGYFDVRRLSDDELSKLNLDPKKFVHDKSGYYAALYKDDVTGSYLLANRGTESLRDVVTDMVNNFGGVDAQFERAVSLANTVGAHKEVGENLTFTGHSLGGALASAQAAAYETGVAITFNAAGLPRRVAEKLDLDFSDQSRSRIQANYLQGDAVSIAQDSMLVDGLAALLGTPVKYGIAAVGFLSSQTSFSNLNITVGYAPEAFGARHMILPANNSWGPLTRHSNSSVLRSLTYNYLLAASAQGSN